LDRNQLHPARHSALLHGPRPRAKQSPFPCKRGVENRRLQSHLGGGEARLFRSPGTSGRDFKKARPTFGNLLHMSVVLRNRYLGSAIETRVSGFTNETILTRYSDEFDTQLRRH
jgi:hypothetical protein